MNGNVALETRQHPCVVRTVQWRTKRCKRGIRGNVRDDTLSWEEAAERVGAGTRWAGARARRAVVYLRLRLAGKVRWGGDGCLWPPRRCCSAALRTGWPRWRTAPQRSTAPAVWVDTPSCIEPPVSCAPQSCLPTYRAVSLSASSALVSR